MIFLAYLVIEVCLLGSIIADFHYQNDEQTEIGLAVLYHLCRFSAHFGFIFLMLITAELFPTSLRQILDIMFFFKEPNLIYFFISIRCTGMGICFSLKMIGSAVSSPNLVIKIAD